PLGDQLQQKSKRRDNETIGKTRAAANPAQRAYRSKPEATQKHEPVRDRCNTRLESADVERRGQREPCRMRRDSPLKEAQSNRNALRLVPLNDAPVIATGVLQIA